jgi:sulfite reductase (NADPH) flavoprotein alpha-component
MSFIAPFLPENAPFSPPQRAWLDGFLAGLIGDDNTASLPSSPGLTRGSLEAAGDGRVKPGHDEEGAKAEANTPSPPEPEDFPWHDPGLSLDERVALAAGRGPARRLMAAMAQTDCGQCGYSCQAYAEAIASGADSSIGRCTPGGKATSRKLKEILAELAAPKAAAVATTPAIASTVASAARALPRPAARG